MRVAFVTVGDTNRRTGGYLYNNRVIAGLRSKGFEVEEISAGGASPGEQEAAAPGLGACLNPLAFDVVVVDALARVAAAQHLDGWRALCPVVAMVHELPSVAGVGSAKNVIREREYEEPLLRADRLIAVSGHGRRLLEERGVPADLIHVVPPGFDRLLASGAFVSGSDEIVRALCVAQWIPRKGILSLIDAWTRRERPGAVLELIGETDVEPEYAARVREAIAASDTKIVVSGAVDDAALARAYAAANLFVLPSVYEGYGMVYAEALSFGLPVIASEVGPVPDLVGREAAVLIPPDDPEALSEALDLLLGNPALRCRMAEAARRRAEDLPRWEDAVAGFEVALRAAVPAGTPHRPDIESPHGT